MRLPQLFSILETLQNMRRRKVLAQTGGLIATGCLFVFLGLSLLDLAFGYATAGRIVLFCVLLGSIVAGGVVFLLVWRHRLNAQECALLAEKASAVPAKNTLINAVQFAEMGNVPFAERILKECPVQLGDISQEKLLSPTPARWLRGSLLGFLLLAGVAFCLSPRGMATASLRVLCPWAEISPYTETWLLDVVPGNCRIRPGEHFVVRFTTGGLSPAEATLLLQEAGRAQEETIVPGTDGNFSIATREIYSPVRYCIHAGDSVSEWFDVELAPSPVLLNWEAGVIPPAYTGLAPKAVFSSEETLPIPAGSEIHFQGKANLPLRQIAVVQQKNLLAHRKEGGDEAFDFRFSLTDNLPVVVQMLSEDEVASVSTLDWIVIPDRPPQLDLQDTPMLQTIEEGSSALVSFLVKDDYGVGRVGLERIYADGRRPENVTSVNIAEEDNRQTMFAGRFTVDTSTFEEEGDALRFRVWAEDNSPHGNRVNSSVLTIKCISPESARKSEKTMQETAIKGLEGIIRLQRETLRITRQSRDLLRQEKALDAKLLEDCSRKQALVRSESAKLLQEPASLGTLAERLSGLVNHEMVRAQELFQEYFRSAPAGRLACLDELCETQTAILAALCGVNGAMESEEMRRAKQQLFELLQSLVKQQKQIFDETGATVSGEKNDALVRGQERIAKGVMRFVTQCAEVPQGDDFFEVAGAAAQIVEEGKAYDNALQAAEELENLAFDKAQQSQRETGRILMAALDLLNRWRMENAKRSVEEAASFLKELNAALDGLEKKQAHITEVTRSLMDHKELSKEDRETLAEMDKEQKPMADQIEKLANDLYQFPDLPVCNELNGKMREIYEDVLQALDSENSPSIEIAVQKEDAILDAIRDTKERIEDVEMWLPDVPDHFVWNMESFDIDEMPDMPLVPLPDELEDIVGELLDQESSIDAESQDTTSNNFIADVENGWAIMDGPMATFGAKGKSGNTRPNDNEQSGRSGSGREGQATGELVENHVSGLEGRETKARKTLDKLQKGQVTEDEESTLKARATGGGKLGGEAEAEGMFGKSPRRDLGQGAHGTQRQALRQETEALYAASQLLYINAGHLGEAARGMRVMENAGEMKDMGTMRRRVMRALGDSQVQLQEGVSLPMPVAEIRQAGGDTTEDETNLVSDRYRQLLQDYYRSLSE